MLDKIRHLCYNGSIIGYFALQTEVRNNSDGLKLHFVL